MLSGAVPHFTGGFMPISQTLLPEFDQEMANTRKLLERVPDGKFDYKPHEKSMTLGRLAGHVAQVPTYPTSTIRIEKLELTSTEKPYHPTSQKLLLQSV